MNILPQIAQITQRNAAGCIISQRKTGLGGFGVSVVLGFVVWVLSAIICEISGRHMGFFCRLIKYACMLFSRRWRRSRRGMLQAALYRRERQVGVSVFWSLSVIISERHWVVSLVID